MFQQRVSNKAKRRDLHPSKESLSFLVKGSGTLQSTNSGQAIMSTVFGANIILYEETSRAVPPRENVEPQQSELGLSMFWVK